VPGEAAEKVPLVARPLLPPLIDVLDPAVAAARAQARWHADQHGYFWLPCPLCGVPFGGQEVLRGRFPIPHIPDLAAGPGHYLVICPWCTRGGRGCDVP
jgi:hypothetical protein